MLAKVKPASSHRLFVLLIKSSFQDLQNILVAGPESPILGWLLRQPSGTFLTVLLVSQRWFHQCYQVLRWVYDDVGPGSQDVGQAP
jgi:hypothetical protein